MILNNQSLIKEKKNTFYLFIYNISVQFLMSYIYLQKFY